MWVVVGFTIACFVVYGGCTSGTDRKKSDFRCPAESGMFANPYNCRHFYNCEGFVAYDTACPARQYFNDAEKTCTYQTEDLQCGSEVTTLDPTAPDPDAALKCLPAACMLPGCFCSEDGTRIPERLFPSEIPQMVILAFSGPLNVLNAEHFGYLLNESRINANGCPIKATFFVPHEYTSYYYVQKLHGQGHEFAMQSITNRLPEEFWSTAGIDDWVDEVIGMREILHTFGNISRNDLVGMRAPFLEPGGNNMMSMMFDYGLQYDSSLIAPPSFIPIWPYTLDFRMPHTCLTENCPSESFPAVWEFPLNTMQFGDGTDGHCVILDQCVFPDNASEIYNFLQYNFQRHFYSNKAPFVLNMDVNWVTDASKMDALDFFIEYILNIPNVWIVTMQQALDWMMRPVTTDIQHFEEWKCPKTREPGCDTPKTCAVRIGDSGEIRYIQVCDKCPEKYPWVNNVKGTNDENSMLDLYRMFSKS